jgi:hypothetical protein
MRVVRSPIAASGNLALLSKGWSREMPIIARLRYCVIAMYFDDHNPPHFHILGPDGEEALVRLGDLAVLKGEVDRRALKEALDWAAKNEGFLRETWNDFQDR